MAAIITETEYNVSPNLGGKVIKFKGKKATQHDWIVFADPVGLVVVNQLDGTVDTVSYATGLVHTSGITAASTSMVYDDVTAAAELPATSGYVMVADEIIGYTAGGAGTTGTLTGLKRGCFGTTAAAASDGDTFYILNTILLGDSVTGLVRGIADVIEE